MSTQNVGVDRISLWTTETGARWFLIPDTAQPPAGDITIRELGGELRRADEHWLMVFEISEEQAVRWTRRSLPASLTELRVSLEDTFAGWRATIDAARTEPVSPDTTVTPNAVPALVDFLRALPSIVGQSISGDDARLATARQSLADLQQKLASSGIELDERFTGYADRLAALRRDAEANRDASPPQSSVDHARDDDDPPDASVPSNPGPSR